MKHRIIKAKDNKGIYYAIQRKEFPYGWLFYNTSFHVNGYHRTLKKAKKELDIIMNPNDKFEVIYATK